MSSAGRDDEFDSDIGEDELDEELGLPEVLATIGYDEKKDLYRFKQTHNERDWEEEVLRRSDLFARKIDMERLKRMTNKGAAAPAAPAPAAKAPTRGKRKVQSSDEESEASEEEDVAPKKRKVAAPAPKRGAKKAAVASDSEASAEESEDGEASDAEESDEESEAEDDLFDSEEEEEISKRVLEDERSAAKASKQLGKRGAGKGKTVSTRSSRSKASKYESESEEGEEEDDEEGDEEEELYGKRLTGRDKSGKSKSGSGIGGAFDDEDNDDGNLARIKERTRGPKTSSRGGAGEGEEGGRVKAPKQLSVQAQMQADFDALMEKDNSPPAELSDYWAIQPRRTDMIMKWLNEPFLKVALEGYYVRFTVGEAGGKPICRMCRVVSVDLNSRPYKLAETNEMCTVRLSLEFAGSVKKLNRICQVSNSRITEDEFKFYFERSAEAEAAGKPADKLMTKNQIRAKRKLFLAHTVQHVYTDVEIKSMVQKSIGLDKSKVTEYSTAMESLEKKLAAARASTDYEALEVVQKTIDNLQRKFQDEKEKFDRAASKQMAVNRRMKESNVKRDMAAGNRLRAENQEAAAKGVQSKAEADPFSRRETRPKILWNTGKRLETARLPEGSAPSAAAVEPLGSAEESASEVVGGVQAASAPGASGKPSFRVIELPTLEQIRKRVKQRLGIDPIYEASRSVRDRYLSRVCARLPPLDSEERRRLRQSFEAKSLEDALEGIEANDLGGGGTAMEVQ